MFLLQSCDYPSKHAWGGGGGGGGVGTTLKVILSQMQPQVILLTYTNATGHYSVIIAYIFYTGQWTMDLTIDWNID